MSPHDSEIGATYVDVAFQAHTLIRQFLARALRGLSPTYLPFANVSHDVGVTKATLPNMTRDESAPSVTIFSQYAGQIPD